MIRLVKRTYKLTGGLSLWGKHLKEVRAQCVKVTTGYRKEAKPQRTTPTGTKMKKQKMAECDDPCLVNVLPLQVIAN